ncbi:MAG TPA: hypothetical protein VEV85_08935 [Bryobacteraceae bacterium]|nr:hypothetical protein [Bryobacteraceae bacterium]
MGQRAGLVRREPPRILERIATLLIPPACREEVLGDLQERCASSWGYFKDALFAIPCVIASRIRRIVDPPVLLLHAMVVYLSFLLAAWIADGALPAGEGELWRLVIPSCAVLAGIILAEVYAKPGAASRFQSLRGPLLGAGLAFVSRIAVPFRVVLYGAALSLILASTTNILFPPITLRPQGASVPTLWLKHSAAKPSSFKWLVAALALLLLLLSVRRS